MLSNIVAMIGMPPKLSGNVEQDLREMNDYQRKLVKAVEQIVNEIEMR